jgi:photosystem II stability/assembly factor-like uncharacterized protein
LPSKEKLMRLAGKWKKVSSKPCDQSYPDEIEFSERPRYLARKGPGQGYICWDAGDYEIMGTDQLKLSTATDAQVLYRFAISGDSLTFTDPDGCEFNYRRVG